MTYQNVVLIDSAHDWLVTKAMSASARTIGVPNGSRRSCRSEALANLYLTPVSFFTSPAAHASNFTPQKFLV